jgi:pimeloyl-ACP methyl ester carboxylesterase
MDRQTAKTPQGNVSYLMREGKEYIVLLHGLGGMGNNFLRIAPNINKDYGLIFPDLLGHGKSAMLNNITIKDQVLAIRNLLEKLEIENFYLGGNSYGGWVALSYEITYRNSEGLILIDSAGTNPTVGDLEMESKEKFLEKLMKMNPKNTKSIMENIVDNNKGNKFKINNEELEMLNTKTLIIWGENDKMIPKEYGLNIHKNVKNSKIIVLENGGHTPHISHAEEVSRSINDFLNWK